MRLLAFDTSTETLSMAVRNGSGQWHVELAGGPKASHTLLPQVLALLAQAGLELRALDAIVYGCGPGAFTGLRTACAAAQGLAWGAQLKALPVDSLHATAEAVHQHTGAQQVMAVLDARMNEVYAAPFVWQAQPGADNGGHWQRQGPIRVLPPAALQVPEGFVMGGNALAVYPDALQDKAAVHVPALPTAQAMLALAPGLIAQGLLQEAAQIAPLYIRDKVALTTEERARAAQATPDGAAL